MVKIGSVRQGCVYQGQGLGIYVSDRLEAGMAGEGTKPIVCLSTEENDIGCVGSAGLFRRFREALGKVRTGVPVVCRVLPRRAVGDMWPSRAIALNCRLTEHFKTNGWAFVDN